MVARISITHGRFEYDHTTAGLNGEEIPVEVESQRDVGGFTLDGKDYILIDVFDGDDKYIGRIKVELKNGRPDMPISGPE